MLAATHRCDFGISWLSFLINILHNFFFAFLCRRCCVVFRSTADVRMFVYEMSMLALTGVNKARVDELVFQCFRKPTTRDASTLVLCQESGELLGVAFLARVPGCVMVSNLCTRYGSRRRGVARAIMEFVEAENRDCDVCAHVAASENAAQALLRGRGFSEIECGVGGIDFRRVCI
jgi:GNAT superfamily N-acetyltransferase